MTGELWLVAWVAWTVVLAVAVKRSWVDWWTDMDMGANA
jgi:hypothetical protein